MVMVHGTGAEKLVCTALQSCNFSIFFNLKTITLGVRVNIFVNHKVFPVVMLRVPAYLTTEEKHFGVLRKEKWNRGALFEILMYHLPVNLTFAYEAKLNFC